jgi:glyoxylase-like metal-dependent hydrolase (beta-lactamase superfamily II)
MPTPTYKLRPIHVATLPVPGWECFFGKHDLNFYDLYFYVWLIEGNGLKGLVDTGVPIDPEDLKALDVGCQSVDPKSFFSDVRTLDRVFREEKIAPDEIDFLLITQPITYHTGGMTRELFPKAKVYISLTGFNEFILDNPGHPPRDLYFTKRNWDVMRDLTIQGRLILTDGPTEVAPGIIFETTGGHHPGSAGVKVDTARGVAGILETAFLQKNIEDERPIGVAEDAARCRREIRRYKRECAVVFADHEPSIIKNYPKGL